MEIEAILHALWDSRRESSVAAVVLLKLRSEISLTPALSQREREPRRPACELFERLRYAEGLPRILPLPLGEGRGEGNWSGKKSRALDLCNRHSAFGFRV